MSTIVSKPSQLPGIPRDTSVRVVDRLLDGENKIDHWMIAWSDRLSPIVVKETRQALKSKQFLWTFVFLLIGIIAWTILGISSLMPGIYYHPGGQALLSGYLVMLLIPALVIVPLAAFHSMANELNSNTFEVLSISPLSSHKIVVGKVVVAIIQLLLYVAILAPCVALTYLLRGVSITSLLVIFPSVCVAAFIMISVAVMLGTFSRTTMYMLFFLLVQLGGSLAAFGALNSFLINAVVFDDSAFNTWTNASYFVAILAVISSYGWLSILVAGASIGIAGNDYTKAIRICLSLQSYAIFVIFISLALSDTALNSPTDNAIIIAAFFPLIIHWTIAGVFSVCQSGIITPRMQRGLPTRLSTKFLAAWFSPGGGKAYLFVILNFAAIACAVQILPVFGITLGMEGNVGGLLLAYLALYLGALRLILLTVPRSIKSRGGFALLISILLLALGHGIPSFISLYRSNWASSTYAAYSFISPFSTFTHLRRAISLGSPLLLLYCISFLVFCVNALLVSGDIVLMKVRSVPTELDPNLKSTPGKPLAIDAFESIT